MIHTNRFFCRRQRREIGFLLIGLLAVSQPVRVNSEESSTKSTTAERPNILFIMADDHAVNALGAYGSRLARLDPTPNLDRLASQGMRFTNVFCPNSICAPSRANILTGVYSHINGVRYLRDALDPEAVNVAKLLQKAGYATAVYGKWHLKTEPTGFDDWEVLPGQGRYFHPQFRSPGGTKSYQGHSTDVITELTLNWFKNIWSRERPFMMMCHFKATHEAFQYAERFKNRYEGTRIPEPKSLFEDQSHRSEATRDIGYTIEMMGDRMANRKSHVPERFDDSGLEGKEYRKAAYQHFLKAYLRTVRGIDDNVGRLMRYLENEGLDDNTLVIYTSDQGYFLGEHNYIDKRWIFRESAQMPLLARLPGVIPEGAVEDDLVINIDFAPTMLDFAGAPIPEFMQGRSLRPLMEGNPPNEWRDAIYYHYWTHQDLRPAHRGLRTKEFMLLHAYGNAEPGAPRSQSWELYDLEKDPKELHNVFSDAAYKETVERLTEKMQSLRRKLGEKEGAAKSPGASK